MDPAPARPPDAVAPSLTWVQADERFDRAWCDSIVATARTYAPVAATVGNDTVNPQVRATLRFRIEADAASQDLVAMLEALVRRINERHFAFELTGIRPPDVLEYSPGRGHFDWHCDYAHHSETIVRKITVIVQLSDPSEYVGGDLEVFDSVVTPLPKTQGTVLALPSFVQHRVTPVTSGCRRSLVLFALGPTFL